MDDEIRERCRELLKMNGISISKLFGRGTAEESKAMRQLKSAALTTNLVMRIADSVPNVSLEWLFRGHGDMYLDDNIVKMDSHLKISEGLLDALRAQIATQQKVIELQDKLINK